MRALCSPNLRSLRWLISLFALSLLLSACGGGGGGSSSSGGSGTFTVKLDRSELRITGEEGSSLAPVIVMASASGSVPDTVYLGSLDLGTAIERVTFEANGNQARFTVVPRSNLPPGVHTGSLQLFACRDAQCASQASGSPATLPYTVTVTRILKVNPQALQLTASSIGLPPTATVVVQLPEGASSFSAVSSVPWLAVSELTASGFRVTAQPLPPGRYAGEVLVAVGGRTKAVGITYDVPVGTGTGDALLPSARSLSFSAPITGVAAGQALSVTLPAWARDLDARIDYQSGSGWLSALKTSENSYMVTVSTSGLPAGTYQAGISLSAGGLSGTYPVVVPVTFTVGAANWVIDGSTRFTITGDSTAAALSSDLAISLQGLPSQPYTASTPTPWLKLSGSGGVTGGAPLRISVDTAEMLALPSGRNYTGELVLSASDSRIGTRRFAITLSKSVPTLDYVSPRTRLPGEGGVYTLRGRSFNAIADLGQMLVVSGATPSRVTRVSDTELAIQLPGAPSGEVRFSLRNAFVTPAVIPVLSVVPQGTFANAVIPTVGGKSSLVFDAQRQAVYSVNRSTHSLLRFSWNGTGWTTTSVPLQNGDGVALSPDGASLVTIAAPRSIALFDPQTLEKQASYDAVAVETNINGLSRLAVTNSGRAYFRGSTASPGLPYFDLVSREFGANVFNGATNFSGGGPWFSMSGDGSRMYVTQTTGVIPALPMLYLDSSNEQLRATPATLSGWYEESQSLRGERFAYGSINFYTVQDRGFATIGTMAPPDARYLARTVVLSPDGTRAYVMAYDQETFQSGSQMPRVYVFDSSTSPASGPELPLLGYFDLPDFPTCHRNYYECDTRALGTISPDGKTLFFIGDANFVVAPIPALTPVPQGAGMRRAKSAVSGVIPKLTPVPMGR